MTEIGSEEMHWLFLREGLSGHPLPDSSVDTSLLSLVFSLVELLFIPLVYIIFFTERFYIKYSFIVKSMEKEIRREN